MDAKDEAAEAGQCWYWVSIEVALDGEEVILGVDVSDLECRLDEGHEGPHELHPMRDQ